MNVIELNIDEEKEAFIISGETQMIMKNHRAKYFFLDFLNAKFLDNGQISISYKNGIREQLLKKIQDSLEKYRIPKVDSQKIKNVLDQYYVEQENFKLFSQKAKRIWYNEVDVQEFKTFKESIEKNLPNRRLYDKQLLATFHLAFSQNACNFSVPGAGKTSIVYGAFAFLNNLPKSHPKHINKLLIIGPLSSFGPWEDEYKECFGKPPTTKRLSGGVSADERERYLLSIDPIEEIPELTLMSYDSVPNNLENLTHFLQRKNNNVMVVLDEAHRIKNIAGGVRASAALTLPKLIGVKSRVVLTGTPAPNGYEDIYNLYEFIWPNKDIIDFNIYQLKEMSDNRFDPRIAKLIENISPFFIRIKKSDILDPKNYPVDNKNPIYVNMGEVQREIYAFIENKYISYFEGNQDGFTATSNLLKARFVRLMQAASNPNLLRRPLEEYFTGQGLNNELYIDDSMIIEKILRYRELESVPKKFEATKNLVVNLLSQGEKIIIWAIFIQNIKELQEYLNSQGITSELLIGEVPVETDEISDDIRTRERIIKEFHDPDSKFRVIIANPFAVAESISLHKACHNAIYLERTFNATNFIQSKDRIHRVGLPEGVVTNYHYILSTNTIDETIHARLIDKERRMLALIESQEIPLFSENLNYDIDLKDDLKAIIRDYVRRTVKV